MKRTCARLAIEPVFRRQIQICYQTRPPLMTPCPTSRRGYSSSQLFPDDAPACNRSSRHCSRQQLLPSLTLLQPVAEPVSTADHVPTDRWQHSGRMRFLLDRWSCYCYSNFQQQPVCPMTSTPRKLRHIPDYTSTEWTGTLIILPLPLMRPHIRPSPATPTTCPTASFLTTSTWPRPTTPTPATPACIWVSIFDRLQVHQQLTLRRSDYLYRWDAANATLHHTNISCTIRQIKAGYLNLTLLSVFLSSPLSFTLFTIVCRIDVLPSYRSCNNSTLPKQQNWSFIIRWSLVSYAEYAFWKILPFLPKLFMNETERILWLNS